MPAFIRQGVDTRNVKEAIEPFSQQGAPSMAGTETVAESKPGKIAIFDPGKYTPQVRNHEMEHQLQETRSDGTIKLPGNYEVAPFGVHPIAAPEQHPSGDPRNYSYGGEQALREAHSSGKSVADFNMEQQADMVADYKAKQDAYLAKAAAGKMSPADEHAMYQTYQAYHPLIQQLASQPSSFREALPSAKTVLGIGKPEPLAPAPAAPGLPAYDTPGLGVAPADPLMGGQSQRVPLRAPRPPARKEAH